MHTKKYYADFLDNYDFYSRYCGILMCFVAVFENWRATPVSGNRAYSVLSRLVEIY